MISLEKQLALPNYAGIGVGLEAALRCLGFKSDELPALIKDKGIIEIFEAGRADGSKRIRQVLMKEAIENQNVSAIKLLKLDGEIDRDPEPDKRRLQPAIRVDVVRSAREKLDRMHALQLESREVVNDE